MLDRTNRRHALPSGRLSAFLFAAALGCGEAKDVARAEMAEVPMANKGVLLADLTWLEAEALFGPETIVVIPIGAAAKEHGPHLRLDNDLRLGRRRLPSSRRARLVVAGSQHDRDVLEDWHLGRSDARDSGEG